MIRAAWIASLLVAALACSSCGGEPAFGFGDEPETQAPPDPSTDREVDTEGAAEDGSLATTDDAARATAAVTHTVRAVAILFDELGGAVGDLFPTADDPCPQGGSASGDLSGSISHPRLRMEFHQCVRGEATLDGVATLTCDDFDGSHCASGQATIGDNGDVLFFESRGSELPHRSVTRGTAMLQADDAAQQLHVVATLDGELRALASERRYGFALEGLGVDVHKTGDGNAEVRIEGVIGIGAGAASANCAAGRFDTATPAEPLLLGSDGAIHSGRLDHFSPPPRPGTEQSSTVFVDGGADVRGADGMEQMYTAQELAQFCAL